MNSIALKDDWHYELNGERIGPINEDKIIDLIAENKLGETSLVWKKGMADWSQLEKTDLSNHLSHLPPPLPITTTQSKNDTSIKKIEELDLIRQECLSLATTKSLISAGASALPIPLLDIITDSVILFRVIPEINRKFGLDHGQINQYDAKTKEVITKTLIIAGGSKACMVGIKMTYRVLFTRMTKYAGRYLAREVANFIPIVDIAVGGVIGFATTKLILNSHINMCHKVAVAGIAGAESNALIDTSTA